MSFDFATLDKSSISSPKLILKSNTGLGTFAYKCNGAQAPSLISSTAMSFEWKDSTNTYSLGSLATAD